MRRASLLMALTVVFWSGIVLAAAPAADSDLGVVSGKLSSNQCCRKNGGTLCTYTLPSTPAGEDVLYDGGLNDCVSRKLPSLCHLFDWYCESLKRCDMLITGPSKHDACEGIIDDCKKCGLNNSTWCIEAYFNGNCIGIQGYCTTGKHTFTGACTCINYTATPIGWGDRLICEEGSTLCP